MIFREKISYADGGDDVVVVHTRGEVAVADTVAGISQNRLRLSPSVDGVVDGDCWDVVRNCPQEIRDKGKIKPFPGYPCCSNIEYLKAKPNIVS